MVTFSYSHFMFPDENGNWWLKQEIKQNFKKNHNWIEIIISIQNYYKDILYFAIVYYSLVFKTKKLEKLERKNEAEISTNLSFIIIFGTYVSLPLIILQSK